MVLNILFTEKKVYLMAHTVDVNLEARYLFLASGTEIERNRHFLIFRELVPWS